MGKKISKEQIAKDQQLGELAQKLQSEGKLTESVGVLQDLIKRHPDEPSIIFNLGMSLMGILHHEPALKLMQKACKDPKAPADAHAAHALCCLALQDVQGAKAQLEIALKKDPNSPRAIRVMADLLNVEGQPAKGAELIKPLAEKNLSNGQNVATYAKCLRSCDRREEAVEILVRAEAVESTSGENRAAILYELAAEYEKLGRYDDAWKAGAEANALRPSHHTRDGWQTWMDQRIDAFSAERMGKLPRSRRSGAGFIFIVGMPRSGTTLVEQIIASHPQAEGIGERQIIPMAARELAVIRSAEETQTQRLDSFTAAGVDRLARTAIAELKAAGKNAPVIVDKLMQNFLHAGVIEMILPGAKIIHCQRDPRDTCLSCFLQHFAGPENQAYSRSTDTLAHYYQQYQRIMEHWKSVLETPILDVRYEDIVADKESQARRLIDFVGLEWDDACLESHKSNRTVVTLSVDQVRRPMYTSSMGRWKRYESHLGPIVDLV
ncbi:sulfotransferase [Phycisphaeraceae bacterium AH-315-B13]|nr:sulfotransferase [Phycisphaeraceae bacterium AH-315-B13]